MHQRMGLNLPSSKPSGMVLSFGLGVVERVLVLLLTVRLVDGLSFGHSVVYDANKQAHNQYTEKKQASSLSSNRK